MKDIPWYEGIYACTKDWAIWSYKRRKYMALSSDKDGYLKVCLSKKWKTNFRVHRIVCMVYIPNLGQKNHVNHKNGIKIDNRVENLEWCTNGENTLHSYRVLWRNLSDKQINARRQIGKNIWTKNLVPSKRIRQLSKTWEFIKDFKSAQEASRNTWIHVSGISMCANWKRNVAWGFLWKYTT